MVAMFGLFGCTSPDDTDRPDAGGVDVNYEEGPDVEEGDADVIEDECRYQLDCDEGHFCHDGECLAARTCSSRQQWSNCVDYFDDIDPNLARRAYCDGSYCRVSCLLDEECPEDHLCSDHGRCIPFTGEITGVHPGGDTPAPLMAGVGNTLMHFPIGISQGGYGSRMATDAGRYVESLRPSRGKMHGLFTRGIAIDDGTRQLIFMRAPIIFPSMALHEAVARNLQEETGRDWRHSLVISGTHTHSGPARFWQIPRSPEGASIPMGMLGIDEFHQQAFDWLVQSLTETALEALDDLAPARMGWTVVEAFDTDDVISSDRWGETPPFDDNRALLIRVDDLDDNPRAVLVSFGTHGTVHSGAYLTDDVMVGIERVMEAALGEEYDTYAPVMYFNQNGGTMSPRGDRAGHRDAQVFESLGAHLVDRTFEALRDMETTDEWNFSGHTHRFPIIYEYFDYEGHEFGHSSEATKDGQYLFGGLACSLDGDDDYSTYVEPEEYGCLGVHQLAYHHPITLFAKSQISAFQLNDLTLITMPGELGMALGWQVQRDVRDAYGIDPFDSFTWGYAQDHLLYLMPTNLRGEMPPFPGISLPQAPDDYPDFAISYLQGGYESEMSPWGHRLGDFLVARAIEAVGLMLGEPVEPEYPVPYPDEFSPGYNEPFPITVTDSADVGEVVGQPPAQVQRRQSIDFAWHGGDPGAEMPQAPRVTLERAQGPDDFEAVILPSQAVYDNREFVMLTRLREIEGNWVWSVYWEELKDFPLGTYRFRVNGHYLAEEGGDRQPYETFSEPFELIPSQALIIDELEFSDQSTITFRLSYPPANQLGTVGSGNDPTMPTGSFRMHHRQVASGLPIPVEADVDFSHLDVELSQQGAPIVVDDIVVTTTPETLGGRNNVPVTRVQIQLAGPTAGGDVAVEIDAFDLYGNSASVAVTLDSSAGGQ